MNKLKKCIICNKDYNYQCGSFTLHLKEEHSLSLKDYIIKYELDGVAPKCNCDYCNDDAPFYRGIFLTYIKGHKNYNYIKKQFILKYGIPKCEKCENDVGWNRGLPNKYCSNQCKPNQWNQEKIKKTIKDKYNVDIISKLDIVKEKISITKKYNYSLNKEEILEKRNKTNLHTFGNINPMECCHIKEKQKQSMLDKYGVEYASQIEKNRINSSLRMIDNNNKFTYKNKYNIKKYKHTDLYYQSTYEYHFLEHCESNNIIDLVSNGHVYNYLSNDKINGKKLITDFTIGNFEIEIKSTYILNKQGGYVKINAKKHAVENKNKSYILILDKNYDYFNEIITKNIK